jgi:hypothetical protein
MSSLINNKLIIKSKSLVQGSLKINTMKNYGPKNRVDLYTVIFSYDENFFIYVFPSLAQMQLLVLRIPQ